MSERTIAIVDDDETILELLNINLLRRGYRTVVISDSRQAAGLIHSRKPDLVILDVMMPHVDGWEVLKNLRDDPAVSGIPVIMLTARGTARDRMIGTDILGADEYIVKPFAVDELLETVRKLLAAPGS